MAEPRVFVFNGNNASRVFVNGIMNVANDDKAPVYTYTRDFPLLEFVESRLKGLLLDIPNLLARDYERVVCGMRAHLTDPARQFVIQSANTDQPLGLLPRDSE